MREGIRPPKFAEHFALIDFDAEPMPVLSLYPPPPVVTAPSLCIEVCGLDCRPRRLAWPDCDALPRARMRAPLICQIFNWSEMIDWEGVRLSEFLAAAGVDLPRDSYVAVHSRDGLYFEAMPAAMASDPRVLLATHMNGEPLTADYGGPLRLIVPFLQGYKSVKWVGSIRVTRHDPAGIKRLLGQSKTGRLGRAWLDTYGIAEPDGMAEGIV